MTNVVGRWKMVSRRDSTDEISRFFLKFKDGEYGTRRQTLCD